MHEYIVHINEGDHDRLAPVNAWDFPHAEQRFVVYDYDYTVEGGAVRDSRGICVGHI